MKRTYTVSVEKGENIYGETYQVIAGSAQEALRKALARAAKEKGIKSGWRCTSLQESRLPLIA